MGIARAKLRILLVDDSPDDIELVRRALTKTGLEQSLHVVDAALWRAKELRVEGGGSGSASEADGEEETGGGVDTGTVSEDAETGGRGAAEISEAEDSCSAPFLISAPMWIWGWRSRGTNFRALETKLLTRSTTVAGLPVTGGTVTRAFRARMSESSMARASATDCWRFTVVRRSSAWVIRL